MSLRRKTRNLPKKAEKETNNQMSFFDPVYQCDQITMESESEISESERRRAMLREKRRNESNETLDTLNAADSQNPDDSSVEISTSKIVDRIKQIQQSIEQAQIMLNSMEQFKSLVPGSETQCEKLRTIIDNLTEQQEGYVNLLNLITLTNDERLAVLGESSTGGRPFSANRNQRLNDEEENVDEEEEVEDEVEGEEEEEEEEIDPRTNRNDRRHLNQSPIRPRIESKIGFTPAAPTPSTPTVGATAHSWDVEQNNRHDNSNYDSLVGSLKSDTINWKDQQSTSGDEATDPESEKEIRKNLMLQKEQLRALQGQKRALLALKRRSEKRLIEQQQLLKNEIAEAKEDISENDLLSGINQLRDRLKLLRNLYEQKHQNEIQQNQAPPRKQNSTSDHRLKNLQHVRERLDQLEEIVNYYQTDLMNEQEEESTVYEETSIQPDDVERLKALMHQQQQMIGLALQPSTENTPQHLNQLSNELAAKRLELEQAKSALSRLQEMVEKIEPDRNSPSIPNPTVNVIKKKTPERETNTQSQQQGSAGPKASLLSSILSPKANEKERTPTTNTYADVKMAAQHREIERLLESRQRLHTIKDQIASLHQSMATPAVDSKKESSNNETKSRVPQVSSNRSEQEENEEEDSEFYRFDCESGDGEEIDDDIDQDMPSRIKQGNFRAPEDIVAEHEQNLLNSSRNPDDELAVQMKEIRTCLTSFIEEQKLFNRNIEQHLTVNRNATTPVIDPIFSQFQQQVLTQGLIVNLNSAYREIAVLQSEVNALQTENQRLTSSMSSMERSQFCSRENSKESIYSLDKMKFVRPQARSRFEESNKLQTHRSAGNKFENSSKTSFNSQSSGQQTAIHVMKPNMETTPIKHERNGSFNAGRLSTPKAIHVRSKGLSTSYEISTNHARSSKENLSKSFIIRRRPLTSDQANDSVESQSYKYNAKSSIEDYPSYRQETYDDDEDDDEDDDDEDARVLEKEQHTKRLSDTISNIRPSALYSSTAPDCDNIDIQTLELQIKSIMVQLIPFMRLHINDVFNQSILNHVRERILFLFKQQPDACALIRHFQDQFFESLGKATEKYCGTTIRDCAGDLIRDISDVAFDELVKYKLFENATNSSNTNSDEQLIRKVLSNKNDDTEADAKYQIELAESESRPLMLIGSDEEDNDSDQEENKDSELETAVSRQETTNHQSNESPVATELHSNGHEYILVNGSPLNGQMIQPSSTTNDEAKNETSD